MSGRNSDSRSIESWNAYIIELIDAQEEDAVLGLLPISKSESEEIIAVVNETTVNKSGLLKIANKRATTAYAMAYSLSQTEKGKAQQHWAQINKELNLGANTKWDNERSPHENFFPKAIAQIAHNRRLKCGKIGSNVPSVNFQAGIKRCWTEELKVRLGQINKDSSLPLPLISDIDEIRNYANTLSTLGSTQQLLSYALKSELGVMLVRRLIHFENGDTSKLPDFLVEIFEETKKGRKRKSSSQIREPYLVYDADTKTVRLHFPKLKVSTAITASTQWVYKGIPTPVTTYRTRVEEVGFNENIEVSLKGIQGESDRIYKRSTQLNEQSPFRLYRETDGKEVIVNYRSSERLPTGHYYVIMSPEVDAGEDKQYCQVYGDGNIIGDEAPIEISADYPSLKLKHKGREYFLTCSDAVTLSLDEAQSNVIELWEEKLPLVFGSPIIRLNNPNQKDVQICISSGRSEILTSADGLTKTIASHFPKLEDKVHEMKVCVMGDDSIPPVRFLYWNRMNGYDASKGSIEITNLSELPSPKGFIILQNTLFFDPSDLSPYGEITTKRGRRVKFPKNGVVSSIAEKGAEPQALAASVTLSVTEEDTRNITFHVYGQEEVVITNKQTGEELITLKPRRDGQRGKGANKKTFTLQYLREKAPNQALLANGEPLVKIQIPHITNEPVKWDYENKYYYTDIPVIDIDSIGLKHINAEGDEIFLWHDLRESVELDSDLENTGLRCSGRLKGGVFQLEVEFDYRKLPYGRSKLSIFLRNTIEEEKPVLAREKGGMVPLSFAFFGTWVRSGLLISHDTKRKTWLDQHRYLQTTKNLAIMDHHLKGLYSHNLNEDYLKESLGFAGSRVDWWNSTAQDFSSLAASDFSLKTYKERDLLPTISPTCLSLSSKYSEASNESLTERALNLNESSQLNEGMAKYQTEYSFHLPSFIEDIKPDEERERYFESQVEELLSANHLGYCFSMLEERIASFTDARDESLQSDVLSSYEKVITENKRDYKELYTKFGYETFTKDQLWSPYKKPRKRNQVKLDEGALERIEESTEERTLYRVSVLVWWLALYSRLAAENAFDHNEQSIQQDFVYRVDAVFEKRETLALILTLAPELYAFYTRLFHETLITE